MATHIKQGKKRKHGKTDKLEAKLQSSLMVQCGKSITEPQTWYTAIAEISIWETFTVVLMCWMQGALRLIERNRVTSVAVHPTAFSSLSLKVTYVKGKTPSAIWHIYIYVYMCLYIYICLLMRLDIICVVLSHLYFFILKLFLFPCCKNKSLLLPRHICPNYILRSPFMG